MAPPRRTQEQCDLWVQRVREAGSVSVAARRWGTPEPTVQHIIHDARGRNPDCLPVSTHAPGWALDGWAIPGRIPIEVAGKTVLTGGDLHCWTAEPSLGWQAFVNVAREVRPDIIMLGGDMLDGARVSRHGKNFGSRAPRVSEEVDALRTLLGMLPDCWFRGWVWGNHDARVDTYLANNASELEDYAGSLRDRFSEWSTAWAFDLGGEVELRHRFRGGIHAGWNNVLHGGLTFCTFHCHAQNVRTFNNRRGRSYGIEPGMLGDPNGPMFEYAEGTPSRSAVGFALLTFDGDGHLLPPELCENSHGRMIFRGKVVAGEKPRIRVKARAA